VINDLNRVLLMGYLGSDAKAPKSDNAPVTFSIATTDRWTDEQKGKQTRTEWHNVIVFGTLRKYATRLKKGNRVYIEGQLRSSSYDKTVGGETITVYNHEIAAAQIERVAPQTEAEASNAD
jgi:single-strand DNA-binding protein